MMVIDTLMLVQRLQGAYMAHPGAFQVTSALIVAALLAGWLIERRRAE
nr:Hypothetical protein Drgb7_00020 [uncultured bacterium]